MKDLRIFDIGNLFGTMNGGTIRLSNITDADKKMIMDMHNLSSLDSDYKFTREDKNAIHMNHRKAIGDAIGFDPLKMFMLDQVDKKGTYHVFDREYVEANPNGWTDINADIGIIIKEAPGVVACHPIADCPVIVMEDPRNKVAAVAHCGCEMIDKKLPMSMADALLDYAGTRDEDIFTYVSSCAGSDWTYEGIPAWLNDWKMWSTTHAVELEKENMINDEIVTPKFHIDLRKAIIQQLKDRNISLKQARFNNIDTIYTPEYYSNCAASARGLNQAEKFGRNLAGAFYVDSEYQSRGRSK